MCQNEGIAMARIIEHLEEKLIAEASRLILAEGYSALTIRAVANGCGVSVGTVYNYFPSKDDLLAALLLVQWNDRVQTFQSACKIAQEPQEALRAIYDQMSRFGQEHQCVLGNPEVLASFTAPTNPYHLLIVQQFTQNLRRFCDSDFTAEFIAHSLLFWTLQGKSFEEIYSILKKLF